MKNQMILAILVAAIALFGCASPQSSGGTAVPQKQNAPATTQNASGAAGHAQAASGLPVHLTNCDYTGTWNTDWGTMQLSQSGNHVKGNYTYDSGRLDGTINDGVFVGKWSESPTYSEPDDAGDAEFYFTKDCSAFTGNWRYGTGSAGAPWDGTWFGTK